MLTSDPNKPYDILTFGDMCVDLIMTGDDVVPEFGQVEKLVDNYELEMGGSCNIFACQAAKLGLKVGILGRVGDDDFGRLIIRRLSESGVDTQQIIIDPSLKTGLGVALCQGQDRAILTHMGSLNAIFPEDVTDEHLHSARHLHHGSYFLHTNLRPAMVDIFKRSLSFGMTTSLDTNWDPDESWNSGLQDLLPLSDIFFPNEQEARSISRTDTVDGAMKIMKMIGVHIIAMKRGKRGAMAVSGEGQWVSELPPVSGGDSIGAGDSFDAGFLAGWLRELPLDICLKIANHCGRQVAAKIGGLRGQPDWNTITRLAGIED